MFLVSIPTPFNCFNCEYYFTGCAEQSRDDDGGMRAEIEKGAGGLEKLPSFPPLPLLIPSSRHALVKPCGPSDVCKEYVSGEGIHQE